MQKNVLKVYKQEFENKMTIYNVKEELRSQYFISFEGFDVVMLSSELLFPAKPEEKTYQQLINLAENYLELAQSKISEALKLFPLHKCRSE